MSWIGSLISGIDPIGGDYLEQYLELITSEHNQQPNFMAMLEGLFRPMADTIALVNTMQVLFDIDTAVGVQLDQIGLWVGRTRNLSVPVVGVYYTYDIGPGYDSGIYKGPFDPITGLVALPDAQYRILLMAVIASNHWDGTIPAAYAAYAIMFAGTPFIILIYDFQDMTMTYAMIGAVPDALTKALFTGGYLSLRPDGVRIREFIVPAVAGPVFAYDLVNPNTAGYDTGAYAEYVAGV